MDLKIGIDVGSDTIKSVIIKSGEIIPIDPIKIKGKPLERIRELLSAIQSEHIPGDNGKVKIGISGKGGQVFSDILGISQINETEAIVASINHLYPEVRHVIEIGAESQAYMTFLKKQNSEKLLLEDVVPGGKCAGGTGSFIDYMHRRLKYDSLDEFSRAGLSVENPAGISGRCAVFAESDIVHHYQKGTPRERIVAGIHQAAARNYKSLIQKSKKPKDKVALIGGAACNKCLAHHITRELGLKDEQLIIPDLYLYLTAVGAGLKAESEIAIDNALLDLEKQLEIPFDYASMEGIRLERSIIMDPPPKPDVMDKIECAALGVDIGSVSTKAALITKIDGSYHILASHYRRTEGNPIKAVQLTIGEILKEIETQRIEIKKIVAATTGSGRYLTGYFIGANFIKDEITAQASGTTAYLSERDITIIEIGGQDSKFIELEHGHISDFEMNWACAAGTGALIEKHAKNLDIDIEDFGDIALRGNKPPIINSTCAVFSESALVHFQQNNVSIENLCAGASLASAKNYLVKVVRNRPINETVVFQGAVAFNRGMIGSFETLLQKPITVPPYPHLTGAIGVARLAYEADSANPKESGFRGFKPIIEAEYSLTSFQCAHCNNECHVNLFTVADQKFFQGDRCDRYSASHKKSKRTKLPDLFEEREELLLNIYTPEKKDAHCGSIGIPRGLFFADYYPFFNAFFSELGFQVVPSERTNKKIIALGVESAVAEPCFPIKVAHGHVIELLEKGVDHIFLPAVFSTESPIGNYDLCVTCPYIQSAPDVIRRAIGSESGRFLAPSIFFERGEKHLRRVAREIAKGLGKSPKMADNALSVAFKTLDEFRARIRKRGGEILQSLGDCDTAFVIIGRPYAIYDRVLNMDVAKKVLDEGYLPIPQDFLPLESYSTEDSWPNIYSIQGQKKLAAARLVSTRKNLHGLVITYFGCGPDAFLDQMFKEEVSKHYLTIQIDEHTSDTGIITRIQAYLNSVGWTQPETPEGGLSQGTGEPELRKNRISTIDTPILEIGSKRLWIPHMNAACSILASCFKAAGIDAEVLKRSDDPGLSLSRKYICGDVCLPMLHTTEDMLKRISAPDFDPGKEAFFQGKSGGPCRYGMYFMLEKRIMDLICGSVDMVALGNRNSSGGLGTFFLLTLWDGLVTHDLLEKMLHHTRPYEKTPGESNRIFESYVRKICGLIETKEFSFNTKTAQLSALSTGNHLKPLRKLIQSAREEFQAQRKEGIKRPLIGMVGEFFVRLHEPSNQRIISHLEEMGAEIWLAPMTEFFSYSNYISGVHAEDRFRDEKKKEYFIDIKTRKFLEDVTTRDEHILFKETLPLLERYDDIPAREVVELGSAYVNKFFGGEAILSIGKSVDFSRRKLDGIVNVGPFNCMPSLVVSALSREIRQAHGNIPYLNITFDGYEDSIRDILISTFLSQVKERMTD